MDDHTITHKIESQLGIDEKVINQIFNCIVKGSIEEVQAKRNQFPSITYNAKYNDAWDSINGKCAAAFCDGYIVTMHQRGIFEFITILNLSASCVYILMKEKNFNKIISDCKSDTHYMKCLTLINDDLQGYPQVYGQMNIFDDMGIEMPESIKLHDKKEAVKNAIMAKINSDVSRFVIITFDPDIDTGVKAIYVNVVANDTSTKYRKDWSSVIKAIEIPQEDESTHYNADSGVHDGNVATFDAPAEVKIKKNAPQEKSAN